MRLTRCSERWCSLSISTASCETHRGPKLLYQAFEQLTHSFAHPCVGQEKNFKTSWARCPSGKYPNAAKSNLFLAQLPWNLWCTSSVLNICMSFPQQYDLKELPNFIHMRKRNGVAKDIKFPHISQKKAAKRVGTFKDFTKRRTAD